MRRDGLLLALLLAIFFLGLGSVPLLEPDEGRYTVIPQAMLTTGDWVTPRLDGVVYFEKPPLCYWMNATSMRLFGFGEFQVRLGSALFGLLGAGLAWLLGRAAGGRSAAAAAAAILATTPLYAVLAHINTLDMVLSGCVGLSLTAFWMAREAGSGPGARGWWLVSFAAAALAVLAKGLVGIVLPGGIALGFLLLSGDWRLLLRVPWVLGSALFLALALPWHILAASRNPSFFQFYIVREHLLRYTSTVHERGQPWWFFAPVVLAGFLPWTGLLPAAASGWFRHPWNPRCQRPIELFLWIWALLPVLFFSASQSKLIPYVLPSFLPLAVLAAGALGRSMKGGAQAGTVRAGLFGGALGMCFFGLVFLAAGLGMVERFSDPGVLHPLLIALSSAGLFAAVSSAWLLQRRDIARGFGALVLASAIGFGCIWAAAPRISEDRRFREMAATLSEVLRPEDAVFGYDLYPQTLAAYLGRPVGVVSYLGELEFGVSALPPAERVLRFPSAEQFAPLWNSPSRVYVVATRRAASRFSAKGLRPGREICGGARFVLIVNDLPGAPGGG